MSRSFERILLLLSSVVASGWPASLQADEGRCRTVPAAVTLSAAIETAMACSPAVARGEADLAAARAAMEAAETYPFNPRVAMGVGRRAGPDGATMDLEGRLFQRVEIAGQRGRRIAAARRGLEAARARLARVRRLVLAQVHLAHVRAMASAHLLEVARQDRDLAAQLHRMAEQRLSAGGASRLDLNTARAELGRAEAALAEAEANAELAAAELAEAMGLPPGRPLRAEGDLAEGLPAAPSLQDVLRGASEHRQDLQAFRAEVAAARERLRLARAEGWPDVTVGVFAAREEGTDTILGANLSIPIPLFNRNQGGVAAAEADIERSEAQRRLAERAAAREAVGAAARYRTRSAAAERLRALVMGTLEQSLKLLSRAVEAGSATLAEVTVLRRSLVEAQRRWVLAELGRHEAWIELMVASGRDPVHRR